MDAKTARALYLSNAISIDKVLEQVEHSAKGGSTYIMFLSLTNEVVSELINKGYKVSKLTDPWGVDQTKVEW